MSSYEVCNAPLFLVEISRIKQFRESRGTKSGSVAKIGTEGIIGELNFLWLEPDGIFRSV
jgi:hypothetical protein